MNLGEVNPEHRDRQKVVQSALEGFVGFHFQFLLNSQVLTDPV